MHCREDSGSAADEHVLRSATVYNLVDSVLYQLKHIEKTDIA